MEPFGLVRGVANVFNACLEALDQLKTYKAYAADNHLLTAQFKAEKLRLEAWGQMVGFENGTLAADHHPALEDEEKALLAKEHLEIINEICRASNGSGRQGLSGLDHRDKALPTISDQSSAVAYAPRRRKLIWTFHGKGEREEQVNHLRILIQQLHNLVTYEQSRDAIKPAEFRELLEELRDEREGEIGLFDPLINCLRINQKVAKIQREIHLWLCGRHVPNELYDESLNKRVEGTCNWILEKSEFLDWLSSSASHDEGRLLWVTGPAGFGKTILCARVVHHLISTRSNPVAFFFYSSAFESRGDSFAAARSWISQIALQNERAWDFVYETMLDQQNQIATKMDIQKMLARIFKIAHGCALVVDGLDECASSSDPELETLTMIRETMEETTARLMIVSRDEPKIRNALSIRGVEKFVEYRIKPQDVRIDTELYSKSIVDRKLYNKDETLKSDISQRMAERCEGQFLWLKMQEAMLRPGLNKKLLQRAVNETPQGLNYVYERNWDMIQSLPDRDKNRALALLTWAAMSLRPLTVAEITEAVLVDLECGGFLFDELPDSIDEAYIDSEILGLVGSLVEVQKGLPHVAIQDRTLRLSHFSVKEYLLNKFTDLSDVKQSRRSRHISTRNAKHHTDLAKACLLYINHPDTWDLGLQNGDMENFNASFLHYAADEWYHHAKMGVVEDVELHMAIKKFFTIDNPCWGAWVRLYESYREEAGDEVEDANNSDSEDGGGRAEWGTPGPLVYAVKLELHSLVQDLITTGKCNFDERGKMGQTALQVCCENGNVVIAEALLDAGAPIEISDRVGLAPINLACGQGHLHIVRMLLERGADKDVTEENGLGCIHIASGQKRTEIVRLLVENGAGVDHVSSYHSMRPLHYAARMGYVETVELLLEKGADIAAVDDSGYSPLHFASAGTSVPTIQLLLRSGADVAAASCEGQTPLMCAAASDGDSEIAKLLIENGADVNAASAAGWTALHSAANAPSVDKVSLLLANGADATVGNDRVLSPLRLAARHGSLAMVKALVESGADIETIRGTDLWASNDVAAFERREAVRLFFEQGRGDSAAAAAADDDDARDSVGRTPLMRAVLGDADKVVQDLLAKGTEDINSPDRYGSTPIFAAIRRGQTKLVKLLLAADNVRLDCRDGFGYTLMSWAQWRGEEAIIGILQQRAEQQLGIRDWGDDAPIDRTIDTHDVSTVFCDICSLSMSKSAIGWHCDKCSGGDLDICGWCYDRGMTCLNDSHQLTLRPRNQGRGG